MYRIHIKDGNNFVLYKYIQTRMKKINKFFFINNQYILKKFYSFKCLKKLLKSQYILLNFISQYKILHMFFYLLLSVFQVPYL